MIHPNPSTAMARVVIDEVVRSDVSFVVISPGSRSAALAIAAAERAELETRVVLDERSAAFHALGRAKATGTASVLISTSGTAPANYYPAIIEAEMSLTPLVVLSADRPAEMQGVGANQTIDQSELFGRHVRYFGSLEAASAGSAANDLWRSEISRALARATGESGRPGPVHVNLAFREPTVPVSDDGRSAAEAYTHPTDGHADGRPWHTPVLDPPTPSDLGEISGRKGLIVAGDGDYDREELVSAARRLGWPILATAMSGLRSASAVTAYEHILAGGVPEQLRPDTVVAIGAVGPSTRLENLISSGDLRIRIDRWGRRVDPRRDASLVVHGDPVACLLAIEGVEPPDVWAETWLHADRLVRRALIAQLASFPDPTGAGVVEATNSVDWGSFVVGSSLPIREVDAHLTRPGDVIANRGASGIDGLVSVALGVASVAPGTLALCGDVSLLHDTNGLLSDAADDLVIIVLDNQGGGLFDSLPPARHAPHYERLFVARPNRSLSDWARFHMVEYCEPPTCGDVASEVSDRLGSGSHLIRVEIDRLTDLEARAALDAVARGVIESLDAQGLEHGA